MLIWAWIQPPCSFDFILILPFMLMYTSIGKSFSGMDNQLSKVAEVWSFTEAETQIRLSPGGLANQGSKSKAYLMQTSFPLEKLWKRLCSCQDFLLVFSLINSDPKKPKLSLVMCECWCPLLFCEIFILNLENPKESLNVESKNNVWMIFVSSVSHWDLII